MPIDRFTGPGVRQRGLSLLELIVALVVFSIAVTATLAAVATVAARSADPMIQTQALYIAQGYLDEILSRRAGAPCSNPGDPRDAWLETACYATITDQSPRDQQGDTLPGLEAYRVTVNVASANLDGQDLTRITVGVRHGDRVHLELVAYRGAL